MVTPCVLVMDGKLTTPPPENGNEQQLYDDVFIYLQKQEYRKDVSKDYKKSFEGRVCIFEVNSKDGKRRNRRSREGVDHWQNPTDESDCSMSQRQIWSVRVTDVSIACITSCIRILPHSFLEHIYLSLLFTGGGHFGCDKTTQKICSRYYWQDMTMQIRDYVQTCDTCQRSNPKLLKSSFALHPIPVKPQVWYQIGIDLVGPLKVSRKGNK